MLDLTHEVTFQNIRDWTNVVEFKLYSNQISIDPFLPFGFLLFTE